MGAPGPELGERWCYRGSEFRGEEARLARPELASGRLGTANVGMPRRKSGPGARPCSSSFEA